MYIVKELVHYCNVTVKTCEEITPHIIDYFDFTFVIQGSMTYIANGQVFVLGENDAIFLPPGTMRERLASNSPARYVSFNFRTFENTAPHFPFYMQNIISNDIIKLVSIFPKRHIFENDYSKEKLSSILNYMLYEIKEVARYGSNDSYILKALRYIDEHVGETVSLSQISKHLNISKEHTARLFKSKTGKTVTAYIIDKKMMIAKEMIKNTNKPLSVIAEELGFKDYSYFSRVFKKQFEIAPLAYKANFNPDH